MGVPADARERVEEAVGEVLATGATGDELEEALIDRLFQVADQLIVRTMTHMMGLHLMSLPPEQRKARMFDALVAMGALDVVVGATPKGRRRPR